MRDGYTDVMNIWNTVLDKYPEVPQLQAAKELMLRKNSDYAGSMPHETFFDNFVISSALTMRSPEEDMLSLIGTKIARLCNLLDWKKKFDDDPNIDQLRDGWEWVFDYDLMKNVYRPKFVKSQPLFESIEDTLLDGINYLIILWGYLDNQLSHYQNLNKTLFTTRINLTHAVASESYFIGLLESILEFPFNGLLTSFITLVQTIDNVKDVTPEIVELISNAILEVIHEFVTLFSPEHAKVDPVLF